MIWADLLPVAALATMMLSVVINMRCDLEAKIVIKPLVPGTKVKMPRDGGPWPWQSPILWFSKSFLYHPHRGWTVDLDALTDVAIKCAEAIETHLGELPHSYLWAGVLIRHTRPGQQALYRLTGEADERGLFKGVWPD